MSGQQTGAAATRRADDESSALELDGVAYGFDDESVVEDLSLSVEPGEVVGIIGPSGVGKTTVLRLLALRLRPQEGAARLDGQSAWDTDERTRLGLRRRLGMVAQEASLFDATVARNVAYGLHVRKEWDERLRDRLASLVSSNGTADAVHDALKLVELRGKEDQPARSLSGGEAQRVAFARAVAYDPSYLLLDEPTSDLDPRNTGLIEAAIRDAKQRGIGVVVATHDMHQAERIADRVAVLLDDEFTEVGPTETVFEHPSDERTRRFIEGELVY
jgi:tungstate transport system ATP-binding protein